MYKRAMKFPHFSYNFTSVKFVLNMFRFDEDLKKIKMQNRLQLSVWKRCKILEKKFRGISVEQFQNLQFVAKILHEICQIIDAKLYISSLNISANLIFQEIFFILSGGFDGSDCLKNTIGYVTNYIQSVAKVYTRSLNITRSKYPEKLKMTDFCDRLYILKT